VGESQGHDVTALALVRPIGDNPALLLEDYFDFVATLEIDKSMRWARRAAARRFLAVHPDLDVWMARPTPARLVDLHRHKAWPLLTWALTTGRISTDLELLLAKPSGVDLGVWWTRAHPDDVARVHQAAGVLGWSANWTRQVAAHTLPMLLLWLDKSLDELTDADFARAGDEADRACVGPSTRNRFVGRCTALAQACFQLGIINEPPPDPRPPSRSPTAHAATIAQPAIRREVVRYAEVISTTLRRSSVQMRIKAIRVLCGWLADHHPEVERLDQLDRTRHIEPFLAWAKTRPFRGTNAGGRTIGPTVFHHDIVDLRVFFEDIAEWDWPSAPQRRLLFLSDIPRMPETLPRALPPDADRALNQAIAQLDDPFARVGLTVLRATGIRIGELLDLELDCIVDYDRHGTWLRVPLGKLNTERSVPLDDEPRQLLVAWITNRGPQRALPHPLDRRPTDFVFVERGRRLGKHRLAQGLDHAAAAAALTNTAGAPLHVTPHQLRHTYGTALVNAGMSLPALMALLGHVTPEMTMRYARLSSPTIRSAYDDAMAKINRRRPLVTIASGSTRAVPAEIDWLHSEMLKTRLAAGFCSRQPAAGPCPYANICEQCDNFVPDPTSADVLAAQLDDVETLRHDAIDRGWHDEAARHERVTTALRQHLHDLEHNRPHGR
jgi:integrase